jgi:hypothetical protein
MELDFVCKIMLDINIKWRKRKRKPELLIVTYLWSNFSLRETKNMFMIKPPFSLTKSSKTLIFVKQKQIL